jgi:hypothetical protein
MCPLDQHFSSHLLVKRARTAFGYELKFSTENMFC